MTVTFADTPTITGEGSIRKVDADDPTKGLAGAVIKIEGVDNDFTGTYVTGTGGYLTDVPWKDMPLGSYTAEEVTPPEGYTKSPDVNKTKQTFRWDGKTDIALVFENDAKVKVKLIKLDDSGNPLPGAVFNIVKDGQIIGTEATKADGSITVTDVTEGMYAFVEVSAPAPYARLDEMYPDKAARGASYGQWGKLNNFEFIMNRAYALNRDKLRCRVCGGWLISAAPWAHRINPNLPLDKVNRVNNLVSLHKKCFTAVNNPSQDISEFDVKAQKKIIGYREKLVPSHTRNNQSALMERRVR